MLFKSIHGFLIPSYSTDYDPPRHLSSDVEFIETRGFIPAPYSIESLQLFFALLDASGNIKSSDDFPALSEFTSEMHDQLIAAQDILIKHSLIIFDNPFKGLNKQGTADMQKTIYDLRSLGKMLLLLNQDDREFYNLFEVIHENKTGKVVVRSIVNQ
jgi:hypothetical protein